jgi:cobalt-zinc-cadmium efflux system outer membrane protein
VLASQVQILVIERELVAAIRRACADILRLGEEEAAAAEDLALTEQIRSRIGLSARAGEVPRFDLTRAEAEVAIARKVLETTRIRQVQANFELRRVVGVNFPEPFRIDPEGAIPERVGPQDFERLWASLDAHNPELALAQAELAQKQQELVFERSQVNPRITLRASRETDPTMAGTRLGATVVVPLWDRRDGQIAQGVASAERARAAMDLRRLEIVNGFESAWRAWLAAEAQLRALDSGIVARAREILNTAEAAYRFGERGILETLDAQRQFRAVRLELIAARHAMALSRIELERLTGL